MRGTTKRSRVAMSSVKTAKSKAAAIGGGSNEIELTDVQRSSSRLPATGADDDDDEEGGKAGKKKVAPETNDEENVNNNNAAAAVDDEDDLESRQLLSPSSKTEVTTAAGGPHTKEAQKQLREQLLGNVWGTLRPRLVRQLLLGLPGCVSFVIYFQSYFRDLMCVVGRGLMLGLDASILYATGLCIANMGSVPLGTHEILASICGYVSCTRFLFFLICLFLFFETRQQIAQVSLHVCDSVPRQCCFLPHQ